MLKMLIVEDERWEREGLIDFLDWKNMGIKICGIACDGIEGLELAKDLHPDIIITDIKMPGLNGIEMSKRIRAILPYVKIIVLTGYDDFKYAQEAIRFSANAYLLKPIIEDETLEVMKTVVKECEKEQKEAVEKERLKSLAIDNFRLIENKLKLDLFEGRVELSSNSMKGINYDMNLETEDIVVIIIKQIDLANKLVIKDIEGLLDTSSIIVKPDNYKMEILLCISLAGKSEEYLLEKVKEIYNLITEKCNVKIIIGIGRTLKGISHINESYKQGIQAIEYEIFWGDFGIIKYDGVQCLNKNFVDKNREFLIQLSDFSKEIPQKTSSGEIFELLNELFSYLCTNKGAERKLIYDYFYNIINEISLLHLNLYEDINDIYDDDSSWVKKLSSLENIQGFKDFIFEFYDKYLRWTNEKRNNKNEHIINRLIQLIEEKYMYEISLKTIADEVFLSSNYIGCIFKKSTGKSFTNYLCEYRMEKAKELLKSSKNKVEKVAIKVGIPNVSYFCLIFRKKCGVSPGEYQERIIRG